MSVKKHVSALHHSTLGNTQLFDTMSRMRKYLIILILTLSAWPAVAQENQPAEVQLTSASEIANHLRSHFGIAKAVYLTQVAKQLSLSFASTEQLQQQWQQALSTAIQEPTQFTQINTHALMAQSLIQHTNGMTLNRWRQVDLPLLPVFRHLSEPHVSSQTFNMWLNLKYHWQVMLQNNPESNLFQWHPWLATTVQTQQTHAKTKSSIGLVLKALQNNTYQELVINSASFKGVAYFDPLATALIRQNHHAQQQQTLAFAYDWIEIYQLSELSSQLLTAEEQQHFSKLINTANNYWQNAAIEIQATNEMLYALIQSLLQELPLKFKDPDHLNPTINSKIFSLITDIQNPVMYFSHPLRAAIQENLEVCLNLSVQQNPEPPEPIAENQFNSCLADFIDWGTNLAQSANLAGNLIRLDNTNSINRALELPSVQIINNLIMQTTADLSCQQQMTVHSNSVEWLLAAETVAWFHDRWPGLMADNLNKSKIEVLVESGLQLHSYPACVQQSQPLKTQFELLRSKWERLKLEIVNHVNKYNKAQLAADSDVDLFKPIEQTTNYVPKNFTIKPCDVTQSCGAYVSLKPSTELLNLFPNHLKLAEQFGLGQLEICYDQVQWDNRKTTPSHLDNNKISNFEGQLSIQLNGLYQGEKVFSKSVLSEQRHVYLFGENNQETLDLACPLPIIGKQINTQLDRGTYGLLPNRLTFLTAAKVDINAVINNNWTKWQTELKNDPERFNYYNAMDEVKITLNEAFLQHVDDLQQEIYRKLITNNQSRTNDSALSKAAFEYINHRKLLSHMVTGLYPHQMAKQAPLQSAIKGQQRLVDLQFFRLAYQNQVNVVDMLNQGDQNFAQHQDLWESLSMDEPLAHSSIDQLKQVQSFITKPATAAGF